MTAHELPPPDGWELAVDRVTGKRHYRPPPRHELPPETDTTQTRVVWDFGPLEQDLRRAQVEMVARNEQFTASMLAALDRLFALERFAEWIRDDIGSCSGSLPGAADCGTCTYCRASQALGEPTDGR